LSPEKRITKHQMKQDNFITYALKSSDFIQNNKNIFLIGAAVVVAIIAIIYFVSYSFSQRNVNAEQMFGKAQLATAMNQTDLAITDYRSILTEYGSAKIADKACFYLARLFYDLNNHDSALVYFEKYINSYGKNNMLLGSAYNGAAICFEDKEEYGKAGDYYFKAAELANDDTFSPDYYMNAGRAYHLAGQLDSAEKAYQLVVDNYRQSTGYNIARKKLAEIQYSRQ
jgi:tetratricopeptide (TPR) repeat protein